jgi:hypothetical protein
MIMREGELVFDFSGCINAQRLDRRGVQIPVGMSFVDFVVEQDKQILLIEIKDPSHSRATEKARQEFIRQLSGNELIANHLVPKCRDSYTYLHLMEQDTKPFLYIVLIAIEEDSPAPPLLLALKERLIQRLRHEAEHPWHKHYVEDCTVFNIRTWNSKIPYKITRSPC